MDDAGPSQVAGSKHALSSSPERGSISPAHKRRATGFGIRAMSQSSAIPNLSSCELHGLSMWHGRS